MGKFKVTENRPFSPLYGWTWQDYLRACDLRDSGDGVRPAEVISKGVRQSDTPRGLDGLLAAVGPKLAWQRDALCLEYPAVDFFADHDQDAAKDICSRCLVQVECRTAGEHEVGIWGASTARERARARRKVA